MPRFLVTLCRKTYEYAEVEVEADRHDSAQSLVREMADRGILPTTWDREGIPPSPEILSVEPVA